MAKDTSQGPGAPIQAQGSSQASQAQPIGGPPGGVGTLPDFVAAMGALSAFGLSTFQLLSSTPINTAMELNRKPRVTVAFPPCADELLGLINHQQSDEITGFFDEYFKFRRHVILGQDRNGSELALQLDASLDKELVDCLPRRDVTSATGYDRQQAAAWPAECCLCSPCVTLDGNRNPPPNPPPAPALRRLFIGDAVWAYYFDRMGIHQILGAILDAFASNGRLPVSNGSLDAGIKDDIIALVLEVMVRQTKMGMSSTVRDRACTYRTALGWVSEGGRKLSLDTEVSTGFTTLFHKFIFHALEFYRDKRLAIAVQGAAGGIARPSVATLVTISETLELLKKRFEAFDYGRSYYNTLSAIVWTIAGLSVIRDLRQSLGIPTAFQSPDEFVPAAYDVLVLKRPATHGGANRYIAHRECARSGRDILLDLEVIDHTRASPGQDLEIWLTQVESRVEAYRTSYLTLTGADLATATAPIEQQA